MIGKWNKSVILSYFGLAISILGIFLLHYGVEVKYAFVCLIFAGVCDMFDGTIARRCKRTEAEKAFGIELDSLIDVVDFLALPLTILIVLVPEYALIVGILYVLFGVARLAHFNITSEDDSKPRKYYEGLPVTMVALILPILFLLSYFIDFYIFKIIYVIANLVISILFIIKFKFPKPKLKGSIFLLLLAIVVSILYLFVL